MASLLSWAGNAVGNVEHVVTHNAVTNFVGHNIVQPTAKVIPQFAVDASNQIYNHAVAPVIGTPRLMPSQVTPIAGLARGVGATGSLHQTLGSGLQTGLLIGSGGLYKVGEAAASRVLPTTVLPRVLSSGALGAGYNASAAATAGARPNQILKSAAIGGGLGAAIPLGAEGLKLGVKGAVKANNARIPLNQVGGIKSPSLPESGPTPPPLSKPLSPKEAGQGSVQIPNTKANSGGNMATNKAASFARTFGVSKADANRILSTEPIPKTNLPLTEKGTPAELNTKTSAVLSKMPAPSRALPPATKVNGGLPLASSPGALKQALASKVTAIRNLGTQSSTKLADTIQQTERTRQGLQAKYNYAMPTAQKLSKNDFSNMVDVIEGKAKASSPQVAQAAKETSNALKQVNEDAFVQGTLIGSREKYFPHVYDFKSIQKNPGMYDAALQHLIDTGQAKYPEQAVQLFHDMATKNDLWPALQGNLEHARETDLPGYAKTKDVLNKYIGSASSRIARATHLGTENEVARRLIANIRLEGGNADTATKAIENYLRNPDTGQGSLSKLSSGARGIFGAASLSKAPISHLGQTSNTVVEAGLGRTLKGWGGFLTHNAEGRDFISKTGVINPQELHSYQNQYTSLHGAMSGITAKGLTPVMKMNRSVTALAGRAYGNHLASIGDTIKLQKLGVTGDVGKTLTADQQVQAARGLVNDTMFSGSRATTPISAETAGGKLVGQFRTAYAYKQTGFIYNQVIKEAQKGNLAPLARFVGASVPITAGTVLAKNVISGKKESPGGIATDALGALGGIPGELAVQAAKYGTRAGDLTSTVAGAAVPLAGEALTVGSNLDNLIHGKAAPIERTALKAIPLVGSRVSNALLPPKTGPNAPGAGASKVAPNNTTTTLSAKGKTVPLTQRELKATNPDELTRWQGLTSRAKTNIQLNNPQKYIRDTQLQAQQDQAQGKTIQAFKDNQNIQTTQINTKYPVAVVQAYGLNAAQFRSYLQQNPDTIGQLQQYDKQLVDAGLSSTKFTSTLNKTLGLASLTGSSKKSSTAKPKIPSFKIASSKIKAPKVGKITVKGGSKTFKAPRIAKSGSSKSNKIAVKSSKQKLPRSSVAAIPKIPKTVA